MFTVVVYTYFTYFPHVNSITLPIFRQFWLVTHFYNDVIKVHFSNTHFKNYKVGKKKSKSKKVSPPGFDVCTMECQRTKNVCAGVVPCCMTFIATPIEQLMR